ncbi:MAG: hypothetical protein ACKOCD_10625 [Nitrospiraceae bacterium]
MPSGATEILLLGLLVGISAMIFLLFLPWLVLYLDKRHAERGAGKCHGKSRAHRTRPVLNP